jgi:hypothetical protein
MAKLAVDPATGEIIQTAVMVKADKAPAIMLDINEVKTFHQDPEKLVDKVREQAGFAVFDVSTEKGRAECRSHAANIIRCISPAINASKALAEEAKRVVKQDLEFRKVFEQGVREIAAFHRQPLTEYEAEQERIKEENERLERELTARMEAELLRIQEEAEAKARAEQDAEVKRLREEVIEPALKRAKSLQEVEMIIQSENRTSLSQDQQELIKDLLEIEEPRDTGATDTVTIPREEYDRLVRDSELLEALKFAGVDNWDGYSDAVSMLEPEA